MIGHKTFKTIERHVLEAASAAYDVIEAADEMPELRSFAEMLGVIWVYLEDGPCLPSSDQLVEALIEEEPELVRDYAQDVFSESIGVAINALTTAVMAARITRSAKELK